MRANMGLHKGQMSLPSRTTMKAPVSRRSVVRCNAAAAPADELGFKKMREGVKEASAESLLTPRL